MSDRLSSLISGSDVRGIAVPTEGALATLTPEIVRRIGLAFAQLTARHSGGEAPRIAVGRDSRVSGETLASAMLDGLMAGGAQAIDFGMCTTPSMFLATQPDSLALDAAVMITASHHPWNRNGCKFFFPQGGLSGAQVAGILAAAEQSPDPGPGDRLPERMPFVEQYTAFLRGAIAQELPGDKPLSGLRVMVDAGGGAGGFYAAMLSGLGADTGASQYLEPDGHFSGHIPNPEDAGAMASAGEAVRRGKADLGIIFDADCDRAALLDAKGEPINRNRLIALACAMLAPQHPDGVIVTDSVTSLGLTQYIENQGMKHLRFRRGYRNVIDECARLNAEGQDSPLAIETSGHAAFRDNAYLDDGMYLATRLLAFLMKQGKPTLEEAITGSLAGLREPAEEIELRFAITAPDMKEAGQAALTALQSLTQARHDLHLAQSYEGTLATFDLPGDDLGGSILLRPSVHDPVLALNAESYQAGGLAPALAAARDALLAVEGVDWSPLVESINKA